MARLIVLTLLVAALSGCGTVGGPSSGVYGGADGGGEIRR
jgi:uncharacterized protein YceK